MSDAPTLSQQLRMLALKMSRHERATANMTEMLDNTLDLHNALIEWICNTDHDDAADEISAILEVYCTRPVVLHATTVG